MAAVKRNGKQGKSLKAVGRGKGPMESQPERNGCTSTGTVAGH